MNPIKNELNPAQEKAARHKNGPLLIIAGAGAGKTKTLTHRILNLIKSGVEPRKILAITFTNKAAREMGERVRALLAKERGGLDGVNDRPFVSTFHSLGLHILRENAQKIGLTRHFSIFDQDDSVRAVKEAIKNEGLDPKQFEPGRIRSVISKYKGDLITMEEYSATADEYFPKIVVRVWKRYEHLLAKEKALDFDDLILKAVNLLRSDESVLSHYQNRWHYIHVDEYQDTNVSQYELTKLLTGPRDNICVVGDSDQCLTTGTMITMENSETKPIERVKIGDVVLSNYGSGDCRGARVEDIFTKTYSGNLIRLTFGNMDRLISTPEHMHFAGYRLGLAPQYHFTYLMWKNGVGFRLGILRIYTRGQKRPMVGFAQRANQEHADKLWIISAHKSPNEARVLEYELSLRYRIPTLPFVARKGFSENGYVHDQKIIDQIFSKFDTDKTGKELLDHYGFSINYPHHRAQSRNSNRRNITITLCGDRRGKTPMHRITMVGNDKKGRETLLKLGLPVRRAKKGSSSWRFEIVSSDYKKLVKIAGTINDAFGEINVIDNARLGKQQNNIIESNSLPFLPAASILPGMVMFDGSGGYCVVRKVECFKTKKVRLYDLNVEHTHNFIANNITTHNSIYSWRGANLKNILNFEKDYPGATVVLLEENYRSTQNILEVAGSIIKKNKIRKEKNLFTKNEVGEKISIYAAYDEGDEARFVAEKARALIAKGVPKEEIAVLYRANFQSRALEEAFLSADVPYQVLGTKFFERKEVKDVLSYIRASLNDGSLSDIKRIINVPPRGVGPATIIKVFAGKESSLTPAMREKITIFKKLLVDIRESCETKKVSEAVKFVIKKTGIEKMLMSGGDEDKERFENLMELVTLATKYDIHAGKDGIEKLLDDASLASDQDSLDHSKNKQKAVRLMTVHASKGLEFRYVFITGLEADLFPHRKINSENVSEEQEEEERRLFYVALTRAKEKLYLTFTEVRTIFGSRQINTPSEFLGEIRHDLVEFEIRDNPGHRVVYLD